MVKPERRTRTDVVVAVAMAAVVAVTAALTRAKSTSWSEVWTRKSIPGWAARKRLRRGTSHWTHKFAPKVNQRRIKEDAPASGYFLDCSALASYPGPFDASGVPLIDYPAGLGRRYNPGWIGEYALACYQRYLEEKDGGLLDRFLCQLDWFVANQRERGQGQFIVWPYLFDWHGDLNAPWISCSMSW